MVVRPLCRAVHSARAVSPNGIGAKKFVLLSIVVVPSPSFRFATVATVANLKDGEGTTTIESKTNFFAPIPLGDTARAECTALHKGRTTMVWQTKITRGDGRLCAVVTQTQMVLRAKA